MFRAGRELKYLMDLFLEMGLKNNGELRGIEVSTKLIDIVEEQNLLQQCTVIIKER
jgi:hypothetical protein